METQFDKLKAKIKDKMVDAYIKDMIDGDSEEMDKLEEAYLEVEKLEEEHKRLIEQILKDQEAFASLGKWEVKGE